ncbi:EVE domain-containing protein [Trichloromonas sp.]|uniref:EVE domain-containing protein n=1 Tax=Trichloromonas sp. TaxID=3069249 RepID=UPI003D815E0A
MANYWLMKSEPGCFSFDDLLQAPGQTTSWDGVRNYQARNLMRDSVSIGDGVLFYHSNISDPVIAGTARVVKGGYPDHTALDPRGEHFDPKATAQNPIWYMVDIQAVSALANPVTRSMLKNHPGLADLDVLKKGNRLSVQPVSECHWRMILSLGGMIADECPVRRNNRKSH